MGYNDRMKIRKIIVAHVFLCFLLTLFSFSVNASVIENKNCSIDLHINSDNILVNLVNKDSIYRDFALSELAKKSYLAADDAHLAHLYVKLKAFKRSDIHNPNLKYAFISLSIRSKTDNQMLYYVHGSGEQFRSARVAYSVENFKNAIDRAISQLPICN